MDKNIFNGINEDILILIRKAVACYLDELDYHYDKKELELFGYNELVKIYDNLADLTFNKK